MWLVYKKCKEKLNFIMEEEKERKGVFTDRRWARAGAILTELSGRNGRREGRIQQDALLTVVLWCSDSISCLPADYMTKRLGNT